MGFPQMTSTLNETLGYPETTASAELNAATARAKRDVSDLALFGGQPAFAAPIHVGRPNIGDRAGFLRMVNDLLDRHVLSNNGPYVQQLEHQIAELLGVEHCVAVCNATVGLEIAIQAL